MSGNDVNVGAGGAGHGPFVVSHPCAVCGGQGCSACRGTGVARFFHGTKAELNSGDLIEPGHRANHGRLDRSTTYVYLTGTLDAATWGAELSLGEGRGRIYIVGPVGSIEDDPNPTDKKFPGNPTKSYRTREPLRVIGEVVEWQGHSPEELKAMRDSLERLRQQGVQPGGCRPTGSRTGGENSNLRPWDKRRGRELRLSSTRLSLPCRSHVSVHT